MTQAKAKLVYDSLVRVVHIEDSDVTPIKAQLYTDLMGPSVIKIYRGDVEVAILASTLTLGLALAQEHKRQGEFVE